MNTPAKMAKPAARSLSSSSSRPSWTDLHPELTAEIFQRLTVKDIFKSSQVCTTWRRVSRDPFTWRVVDFGSIPNFGDSPKGPKHYDEICREVVDRSQGQLVSINLGFFATDDLIFYIAQRAKRLRQLCIWSDRLSDEGFSKAVIEFPLLEELEIDYSDVSTKSIEAAGHSCPLLKSFSLNKDYIFNRGHSNDSNEEALAIAENMPHLKRLSLVGSDMSAEGLEAILGGCPHLESLNLENSIHRILEGDLERRCSPQIKDLKHGYNPVVDYGIELCHDYMQCIDDPEEPPDWYFDELQDQIQI